MPCPPPRPRPHFEPWPSIPLFQWFPLACRPLPTAPSARPAYIKATVALSDSAASLPPPCQRPSETARRQPSPLASHHSTKRKCQTEIDNLTSQRQASLHAYPTIPEHQTLNTFSSTTAASKKKKKYTLLSDRPLFICH